MTLMLKSVATVFFLAIVTAPLSAQTVDAGKDTIASASSDTSLPEKESIWTRDKLTGDWGGSRTKLADLGLDLNFRFSQFYQDVTSGGVDSSGGGAYGLKFNTWVTIDASKLFVPISTKKGALVDPVFNLG